MWESADVEAFYREFGHRLRQARLRAGLSQEGLARSVGVSRTSITNLEKGRQHIPLHMAFMLADALAMRIDELLPKPVEFLRPQPFITSSPASSSEQEWVQRVVSRGRKRR